MAFAEIHVDQKFHPHIIGKNGVNGKILGLSEHKAKNIMLSTFCI